jgi:hypothetical protein
VGDSAPIADDFTGLRFTNLKVPPGAIIQSASLQLYSPEKSWINVDLDIAADASDDSAIFAVDTRPSNRPLTTAKVNHHTNNRWEANTWQSLEDITPVIQEIINRPGWRVGNTLSLILHGTGRAWGRKYVSSFDGDPTHAPRLVIVYRGTVASIPPTTVPTPVPFGTGAGLLGEYYDDIAFRAFAFRRVDAGVNFDWAAGAPAPTMGPDAFSVRWTGQITPLFSETYTFYAIADNNVRLWINNQQIIIGAGNHLTEYRGSIDLIAGQHYPLVLEYVEDTGSAAVKLLWSSASQDKQIIPPSQLTSIASNAYALTAQIAASGDDVNEDGASYHPADANIWLGDTAPLADDYTGLRFTHLNIPAGAVVQSAYLEFYNPQDAWINLDLNVVAEAADTSAEFAPNSRPSARPRTLKLVNHRSDALWFANTWYTLGDLTPIVQEVVGRPGWNAGSNLSIVIKGTGRAWGRKFITSFDGDPKHAPRLVLTFAGVNPTALSINPPTPTAAPTGTPVVTEVTTTPTETSTTPAAVTPESTATVEVTPEVTTETTATPTASATAAETSTPEPTITPTETPTATVTESPTPLPPPTETPTPVPPTAVDVPTNLPPAEATASS